MKRLVVILHRFEVRGGQERSTYEIVTRLARRGWQIEVYSFTRTPWPSELGIGWHRVPGFCLPSVFLRALWFRCYVGAVLWRRFRSSPRPLFFTLGIDSVHSDVRCVQFLHTAAEALVRAGKLPHPNARTRLHELYQELMLRYHARLERRYLGRCRALVAISHQVERDIRAVGPVPPVFVIPHAPDVILAPVPLPSSEGATELLFVGTLERKGIEKALQALGAIKDLSWRLSVLGGGDLQRWRALADEQGIAERTSFFGERPAAAHFAAADVLLLPSRYEPFGLVVTEAVSAGCLPLASSECGAMELWQDRPAWLRLSAFDEAAVWTAAIRKLVEDRELRRRLAQQAQEAFGRWSWDQAASEYERALLSALPGNHVKIETQLAAE